MKKTMLALATVASLAGAGCTTAEKTGVGGAAVGALAGQAIGGDTESTVLGAAIGGLGGYLIGRSAERGDYCEYEDRRRRPYKRYLAPCE